MITAKSGDGGDSVVSFIWTIFISESGDIGELMLCLIWKASLCRWYLNLLGRFECTSLSINVADVLAGYGALSGFSSEGITILSLFSW